MWSVEIYYCLVVSFIYILFPFLYILLPWYFSYNAFSFLFSLSMFSH